MSYIATMNDKIADNTDTVRSILQNVQNILRTPKGTVPLYRDFGVNMDFLDLPPITAELHMRAEIRESVEKWEPRVSVRKITLDHAEIIKGKLGAEVEVEIVGEG